MIEKGEIRVWKDTSSWRNNPDCGKAVLVLDVEEIWVTFLQDGKIFTHEEGSFERLTYSLNRPENSTG